MIPIARHHRALLMSAALSIILWLPISTVTAEPQRTRTGAPPPTDKTSTHAEARSINHVLGARLANPGWEFDLTDNDDDTKLTESSIAIRYAGAAEWTNEIEIRYRGSGTVTVDMLRPHDQWITGAASLNLEPADDWTIAILTVTPDRYQGFTVNFDTPPGHPNPEVTELGAYWFEIELTRDAKETADEWCEDYPGTGNDLSSPNNTAQRFSDYLDGHGWTWLFDYGNNNAWETDYKRVDLGGNNNNWLDATDTFLYCGHGVTDALFLANTTHDDSGVTEADIDGCWGDNDLEWAFFHCCLNLKSTDWHHAFNGAHTISGAINVINGSSNYGKTIARKLIDNGIFDSSWSIYSAWWHANDSHQPAGNKWRLLAEDQAHYNERIWGEGTVQPDSPDNTHWTVSHTVSKAGGRLEVFDPTRVQRTSEPIEWTPSAQLGDPANPAMKVFVHPEVLQKALPDAAWIMRIVPPNMDDGTTGQMFERLCEMLGIDCSDLAVGREDAQGYAASSGLATLSGDIASGGWQFTNDELHQVPEREGDIELGPEEAAERAFSMLSQLDIIGPNNFLAGVNVIEATEFTKDGNVVQTFPFAYDVVVGTNHGGDILYPVVGGGGRTHVAMGVDGQIQAFNQVSRQVIPSEQVQTIAVEEALNQLTAFGFAALQNAPEFPAEEITIRDVGLGYFEQGISTLMTRMGPVYYMDVDLTGPDGRGEGGRMTAPGRLYMAADALPVHGRILAPEDGQTFEYGTNIAFRSSAINGAPPYSFAWYSDIHGLLSNEQHFTANDLLPSFRESGEPAPISIELRVTDSTGFTSTDQVAINITGVVGVEDIPAAFELTGNSPNPFNPRTTIAFAVPVSGQATLRIMDVRGRLVRTLVEGSVAAGRHARVWDGADSRGRAVASGVYLYRLEFQGTDGTQQADTRRMVLVR